jgi:hypothetical protein
MSQVDKQSRLARGYALITVLVLGALFMAVTAAVGTEVVANMSATQNRLGQGRARFAAYSGLQHAVYLLRENPGSIGNLEAVQMPSNPNLSYTVEITDNRAGLDPMTAPDGTPVPPGAVHCASMGVDNEKQQLSLHAMTGTLSSRQPVLTYAAFSDNSFQLDGYSLVDSFDSTTCGWSVDANGRSTPSPMNGEGDVGSNRYLALLGQSTVNGDFFRPALSASSTEVSTPNESEAAVQDLPVPVDVPKYTAPVSFKVAPTLAPNPASLSVSTSGKPTLYKKLVLTGGSVVDVAPGEYYFPEGMQLDGVIEPEAGVDQDNPIIFYAGDDVSLSDAARVNTGGESSLFQLYFVDTGKPTPPRFMMGGGSQFFGTVVGNQVEGVFQDSAELYGGFMGRSVETSGHAKLFFDESLATNELHVAGAWSLSGVTEPKPESVLATSTLAHAHVTAVRNGTIVYNPPVAVAKALPAGPSL